MLRVALVALVAIATLAGPARADADAEVERGHVLAKAGDYQAAIAAFKAADAASPRAHHACLIGLAYLRWRRLTQADLAVAACARRATTTDPAPTWLAQVAADIEAAATTEGYASGSISVDGATDATTILVGDLPVDEAFRPGQIVRLAPGTHRLVAATPGQPVAAQTLDVGAGMGFDVTLRQPSPGVGRSPGEGGSLFAAAAPPAPATHTSDVLITSVGVAASLVGLSLMVASPDHQNLGLLISTVGAALTIWGQVRTRSRQPPPSQLTLRASASPAFAGLSLELVR